MPVVLVRIDDRLIHGQVVEAWIPFLKATRVIVVSDAAASDPTQQALMSLAMPEAVALEVLPVRGAAAAVRDAEADEGKTLVLVPGPAEALALLKAGARFGTVNVGGLHHAAGRVQLGRAIFIDDKDAADLGAMVDLGVRLEGRAVPSETPSDVASQIRAKV